MRMENRLIAAMNDFFIVFDNARLTVHMISKFEGKEAFH